MPTTARAAHLSAALLLMSVVFLGSGVAAIAAEKPRNYKVPEGIASDCSADVTARLTSWIKKTPNHATLSFARNGCYRIDGSLRVENRKGLTLDGNGATLQAMTEGTQARRHLWFVGGKDLAVRNLTVRGANPNAGASRAAYVAPRAFQHAFSINGVTNMVLDRVEAYDVFGDFVYIGNGGVAGQWSKNVRVTNSRFERSGRQGIAITAGQDIVIKHNVIRDVARSVFDLESNTGSGGAINVSIERNVTGAAVNFWLANKGAGTQIRNVTFDGNVMDEGTGGLVFIYGPLIGFRGPYVFTNNTLIVLDTVHDEGSRGAFFLSQASGVTIRNNVVTFPVGRDVPAVELRGAENVEVEGNTFVNAGTELIETVRAPRP